jgi:signal transduction histidine kinase
MSYVPNIDQRDRAKTLKFGIAVLVATMVLAMWVSVGASIYFSRETALAKMTSDADNLALAFDDELTHTLNTVAGTMDAVANRMRAKRSDMNIYAWSYEIPIVTSPIIEATIIGPNGLLIASTKAPVIKPVDVSDLKHIRIQLDGKFKGLFIGPPVISRVYSQISGVDRWIIPISERVETKDGRFLGVLDFVLSPDQLTSLYKSINLGQSGTIGLIGVDNIIRARFSKNSPDGLDGIGQSIANNYGPGFVPENAEGSYVRQTKVDHIQRLYSYRRVADYPLFVSVGLGYDEGMASWRTNAKVISALAAIATLLLGGLAMYLIREIGRRTMREIELAVERNDHQAANIDLTDERRKLQVTNIELTDERQKLKTANIDLTNQRGKLKVANIDLTDQRGKLKLANIDLTDQRGKLEEANIDLLDERGKLHEANIDLDDERGKLKLAYAELLESKNRAEVANDAKSLFLANMSHELRTPLNAILGFSEIIKDQIMGPGKPVYADYAKDIYGAGEHLLELINNLLDISKIEAGKINLRDELIDPAEIVAASLATMRVQAARKCIALAAEIPPGTPFIRGDALRLRQVLINLVSNAVKFTDAGHVTVSVACDAASGFSFTIADTGIGMSAAEIVVALEPFGQIDNALSKKNEGTGLGLPLAQRLIELHGGRLEIESVKGVGTTVRVYLPLDRVVRSVPVAA